MSIEPKATSDTTNFGLTKPDPSDHYDIEVFNQIFDIIDQALQTLNYRNPKQLCPKNKED